MWKPSRLSLEGGKQGGRKAGLCYWRYVFRTGCWLAGYGTMRSGVGGLSLSLSQSAINAQEGPGTAPTADLKQK